MIIQITWLELDLSVRWTGRSPSTGLPASARDFKTPTQYPDVGDYKGRIGLSPPTAYPSAGGHRHIRRFPCTRAPRLCTKKLPISPQDFDPTDQQARTWANPKEQWTTTSTLALLLLIQIIWMIKHKVEHVKIITHKLYASSYIMIITWKLYSRSYALLYKWYESMTLEELFIVLFIPSVAFLPRRQALQVALAFLTILLLKLKEYKRWVVR